MSLELDHLPLTSEDTIRVLTIHPGDPSDQLLCSFGVTKLNSPCDYEAISYAWGSSERTHIVISQTGESHLAVPASCYAALSAIRNPRQDRVVWIDSICINQDDLAEKAIQVSLMGKIYANSACTLVYLGEDDGTFEDIIWALRYVREQSAQHLGTSSLTSQEVDDEFAFPDAEQYFDQLADQIVAGHGQIRSAADNSHYSDEETDCAADEEDSISRAMKQLEGHDDSTLDYVVTVAYLANELQYFSQDYFPPLRAFHDSFFDRLWFKRLWVIQEVALSKKVRLYLGRQSAHWGTIMAFYNLVNFRFHQVGHHYYGHPLVCDRSILGHHIARKFMRLEERTETGYDFGGEQLVLRHRNAFFGEDESNYENKSWPFSQSLLLDLLYDMRTYGCQDGRDRLFAILSILEGPIPQTLMPTYDPAVTQADIFNRIARHQIDNGRFDVLASASGIGYVSPELRGLATWATNWIDAPEKRLLLNSNTLHAHMTVGTKANMPLMKSFGGGSADEIVLRGMVFDEITYVSETCPMNATEDEFISTYSCWIWVKKYVHAPELGNKVHYWLTSKKLPEDFFQPYSDYEYLKQDPLRLIPDPVSEESAEKAQSGPHPAFVKKDGHQKASLEEICWGRAFATVGSPGELDPERLETEEMYLSEPYEPSGHAYSDDEIEDLDEEAPSLESRSGHRPDYMVGPDELITRDEPEHLEELLEAPEEDASTERRMREWRPWRARCLVPHGTREGDLVCGLLGCEVAIVLRPHGKRFRFIGTTTCAEYTIVREAPHLDWNDLLSERPQAPLRDFRIF